MSFIQKIEIDYLTRLVARTRRDDAALIARYGLYPASDSDSAQLLWALLAQWPHDQFDEVNIAVAAPYSRRLMAALGFMRPTIRRLPGSSWKTLSRESRSDVLRWILTIASCELGGLLLDRNRGGWCTVEIVGRRQ